MKIAGFRFGRLRVPLKSPCKTISWIADTIDDLVVMIDSTDGRVGHGSAAMAMPRTGDTFGSLLDAIRHHIAPRLIGEEVENLRQLLGRVQAAIPHNAGAKAAVDVALHDLFGQCYGASTYRLLGGGDPALTTAFTISIDYIDKMVIDAVEAVGRGFETLKLMVGKDPGIDVERIKAVHAAVVGRAVLRVDAGNGWTAKQAVRVLGELEDAGIRFDTVEHAVTGSRLSDIRFVTERVDAPIVAHVDDRGLPEAVEIIRERAADVIAFSLLDLGGIQEALHVCDLASRYGVECMLGCLVEGPISAAAAAHVAVARADVVRRVDLDAPAQARWNPVTSNVCFADAEIRIHDSPGLGITAIQDLEPIPS
jgi:L-alanine-DL-glutamate epimerase-like enolase superfamily enzyme